MSEVTRAVAERSRINLTLLIKHGIKKPTLRPCFQRQYLKVKEQFLHMTESLLIPAIQKQIALQKKKSNHFSATIMKGAV